MDRSWQNSTNPDYIDVNPMVTPRKCPQSPMDNPDFLAFSDSPQINRFVPSYYSSPQTKFYKNTPRNYPPNRRSNHRWSNNHYKSRNNSSFSNHSVQGEDISKFIHPSFLEDPWAELEAKLKQSQQEQNDSNTNHST